MEQIAQWISIGLGLISAALWLKVAFLRVPRISVPYGGVFKDDHEWIVATEKVAQTSKSAAMVTAAATFAQACSALFNSIGV